jgi:hypothetical protein
MTYKELFVKYPKLYSKLSYFECDIGWFSLIDELSKNIEAINEKYSNSEHMITAAQVKEKFGGLRFYVDSYGISNEDYETCTKLISEAENLSYTICEMCGTTPASVTKTRWIRTLCDKCR